jgi:hypothetical protein
VKKITLLLVVFSFIALSFHYGSGTAIAQDWKALSEKVIEKFDGRIISIEKFDNKTCWAVLNPDTTDEQAIKSAEEIGEFIKKSTAAGKTQKPLVRVFVGEKQVAIAHIKGDKYSGILLVDKSLNPMMFKGQYRP